MRDLVAAASGLRVRSCESDLAALLLEIALIQELRPPFNVSGAFTMLYRASGCGCTSETLICAARPPRICWEISHCSAPTVLLG